MRGVRVTDEGDEGSLEKQRKVRNRPGCNQEQDCNHKVHPSYKL